MEISELIVYPLKSARGHALQESFMLATGFPGDRCYLLVDQHNRFISQRSHPAMARLEFFYDYDLQLGMDGKKLFIARQDLSLAQRQVKVWSDEITVQDLGDQAAQFLSERLASPVRLCAFIKDNRRLVSPKDCEGQQLEYYFADAFPYLVVSQESLDFLNDKLLEKGQLPVIMNQFRPNIVIKNWQAYAEDKLQTLCVGDKIKLRLGKMCSRCNIIGVDQRSGQTSIEPLQTLSHYRKLKGSKIYFGAYAWLESGEGELIKLGDPVQIMNA